MEGSEAIDGVDKLALRLDGETDAGKSWDEAKDWLERLLEDADDGSGGKGKSSTENTERSSPFH